MQKVGLWPGENKSLFLVGRIERGRVGGEKIFGIVKRIIV
jgi:hypothetical protein